MSKSNRRKFLSFASSLLSAAACKTTAGTSSSVAGGQETFDYIVVGSGAGGGPLAVNLARAGFSVLLLEAGNDQGQRGVYQVPALHTQSTEDPAMAWDFYVKHFASEAQDREDSKYVPEQRGILYPRAGTVGGCTAHNAMITVYPLRRDWERMASIAGDPSFSPQIMRRYFELWERAEYSPDVQRRKGWLPINLASPIMVVPDRAVRTMVFCAARMMNNGIFRNISLFQSLADIVSMVDTNADTIARDTEESIVRIPMATTSKGRRFSTRDLVMNQVGRNLTLRTNCLVSKVLFDDTGNGAPVAIGVEYLLGEKIYKASKNPKAPLPERMRVRARREVILAAGTFNTPQIMMASGLGPKADLERFTAQDPQYKVRVDLPGVGENLQDRYEIGVVMDVPDDIFLVEKCLFQDNLQDPCFADWNEQKDNIPYTSNGGIIGILKKSKPELESPDLFIFLLPVDFRGYYPGYSRAIAEHKKMMTWAILKSHTHNRAGYVKIKDLDPTSVPEINFMYYEDGNDPAGRSYAGDQTAQIDDLDAVVAAIKHVRKIIDDANHVISLGGLRSAYFQENLPGREKQSDADLREWVRRNSWGHHACGTCRMGRAEDPNAVVDSKFRVRGVKNLRIVDASVLPEIPGYFIVSSLYTISEKASDDILADAGVRRRIPV